MDIKQELETSLEQCIRDRGLMVDQSDKEIAELRQKIADAEVTYSIGDRFKGPYGKYIFATMGSSCSVRMVNITDGGHYGDTKTVGNNHAITANEMGENWDYKFARYWDARKKVKV